MDIDELIDDLTDAAMSKANAHEWGTSIPRYEHKLDNARVALRAEFARLTARIAELKEAMVELETWAKAYPIEIFPEPDMKKAHEILKANGMTLDAISASNMRHVINNVAGIARRALAVPEEKK